VMDGVDRFRLGAADGARGHAQPEQLGVEDLLLGGGMDFEERGQPPPYRLQSPGVGAVDLLQDGEEAALLVIVVQDQLGDVHGFLRSHGNAGPSPRAPAAQDRPRGWSTPGRVSRYRTRRAPTGSRSRRASARRTARSPCRMRATSTSASIAILPVSGRGAIGATPTLAARSSAWTTSSTTRVRRYSSTVMTRPPATRRRRPGSTPASRDRSRAQASRASLASAAGPPAAASPPRSLIAWFAGSLISAERITVSK